MGVLTLQNPHFLQCKFFQMNVDTYMLCESGCKIGSDRDQDHSVSYTRKTRLEVFFFIGNDKEIY